MALQKEKKIYTESYVTTTFLNRVR